MICNGFNLSQIQDIPAVYILLGEDEKVLYIGATTQLRRRLISHLTGSTHRHLKKTFKDEIRYIKYIRTKNDFERNELEKILYHLCKPVYCMKKIIPQTLYVVNKK